MTGAGVRVGRGTRLSYDGEVMEIVELICAANGTEVVVKEQSGGRYRRLALRDLMVAERAKVIAESEGPSSGDLADVAEVVLATLSETELAELRARAGHVREVLTGYRSGSALMPGPGEPRPEYFESVALVKRYEAKATELGVGVRTVERWVYRFQAEGEAGLAPRRETTAGAVATRVDPRWIETALEVMIEHTDLSRPSRTMVIDRTSARVIARFGPDVVKLPARATAFRVLEELERRHPTFRLSTKRNRDIASRPDGPYGKLRPTRPGEYVLMDTTPLDVFALDPLTLRWVRTELTVAMDWYTRCVLGIRLTPVSTKAVDAAATLYQVFRPRPAGSDWPAHAVWPEHGIPRSVLIDVDAIERPSTGLAAPAMVPETIVIDHGKIFVSEHLTSVCRRMGISIQPARLRTGRDKGPVERFFRTLREDLLQALPGYKGPDLHSRGVSPENEAFFYLDELETIIREWTAVVYHHRPHRGLVDPFLPSVELSPAAMYEHGLARAGWIEVPRDPDLAYEFLKVEWRTLQHYGFELNSRRYQGELPESFVDGESPYPDMGKGKGRSWPVHIDPDDVTRVYVRDPENKTWRTLVWEHAKSMRMPLSEDALDFARRLAKVKYTYPDDKIAVADLLERWNLGLGSSIAERRMALRLSRKQSSLDIGPAEIEEETVTQLPSVRRLLELQPAAAGDDPIAAADVGDDDGEDDFYADALEYL